MSGKRTKTKTKTKKPKPLPKYIRDELRMTCALKGFSKMKCGRSKKLKSQYEEMTKFYHGDEPNRPSQIKLLANAHINYRDLYDEVMVKCKNKKDTMADIIKYRLKK